MIEPALVKPAFSGPVEFCGIARIALAGLIVVVGRVSPGIQTVIVTTASEASLTLPLPSSGELSKQKREH